MPRAKYAPKHRGPRPEPAVTRRLRTSVRHSGIAVAVTGVAVTGGVAATDGTPADPAATVIAAAQAQRAEERAAEATEDLQLRTVQPSRARESRSQEPRSQAPSRSEERPERAARPRVEAAETDLRSVARRLMSRYGLSESEFGCLDALWVSESDWDPHADNPTSSAYGIPQALTGGAHANLPEDYMTNPVSQIEWGLWYIAESYGTACAAWEFKQANNWY